MIFHSRSALADATSIEEKLDSYDRQLQTVRDYMEAMEERDGSLQTVNTNMESLMKTLQEMVDQLEFSKSHEIALTEGNLDKADGIAKCSVAAVSLRAAMASTLHPGTFCRDLRMMSLFLDLFVLQTMKS